MLRVFHRHVMRLGPGRGEEDLLQQGCRNFPLKSRPFTLPWPREGTSCRPWRGEGRVTKKPGISGSPPRRGLACSGMAAVEEGGWGCWGDGRNNPEQVPGVLGEGWQRAEEERGRSLADEGSWGRAGNQNAQRWWCPKCMERPWLVTGCSCWRRLELRRCWREEIPWSCW